MAPQIRDARENSMAARTRNRAIKICLSLSFGNKSTIMRYKYLSVNYYYRSIQMTTKLSQFKQNKFFLNPLRALIL